MTWLKRTFSFIFVILGFFIFFAPNSNASWPELDAKVNTNIQSWYNYSLPDGGFSEIMLTEKPEAYGLSLLGYVFIREGIRYNNQAWIDRGILAISKKTMQTDVTPFDMLAIPEAWLMLDQYQSHNPLWIERKPQWTLFFQTWPGYSAAGNSTCMFTVGCYNNWLLVMASGNVGLQRLAASNPSLFSPERQGTFELQNKDILNNSAPINITSEVLDQYGDAALLSDPEDTPLAYALFSSIHLNTIYSYSTGYFDPQNQSLPAKTSRYIASTIAPDGDASWFGRSYQQSWTTAGVLLLGLQSAENDPQNQKAYLSMAQTALQKLAKMPTYKDMIPLTDSVVQSQGSYEGIDNYGSSRAYNALTLFLISKSKDIMDRHPEWNLYDSNNQFLSLQKKENSFVDSRGGVAWLKNNKMWIGIRASGKAQRDARYSDGIVSIKKYNKNMGWHQIGAGQPFANLPTGLSMKKGSKIYKMTLKNVVGIDDYTVRGTAIFKHKNKIVHKTPILYQIQKNKLTIKLKLKKGVRPMWTQTANKINIGKKSMKNSTITVKFSSSGKKLKAIPTRTALQYNTNLHTWQANPTKSDLFTITMY